MKQEVKKMAIISGRGIGKETAIILAKKSVNVLICSRTRSEINSAAEDIKVVPAVCFCIFDFFATVLSKNSMPK
jgi:short-subunit dehydrogenase